MRKEMYNKMDYVACTELLQRGLLTPCTNVSGFARSRSAHAARALFVPFWLVIAIGDCTCLSSEPHSQRYKPTMQAHLMHGLISANVDLKGVLHLARRVGRCTRTHTR